MHVSYLARTRGHFNRLARRKAPRPDGRTALQCAHALVLLDRGISTAIWCGEAGMPATTSVDVGGVSRTWVAPTTFTAYVLTRRRYGLSPSDVRAQARLTGIGPEPAAVANDKAARKRRI